MLTPMKREVTQKDYDALTEAYRRSPPSVGRGYLTAVARESGCCIRMAKRAWHKGWPSKGFPPIRKVLGDEHPGRRALASELRETLMAKKHLDELTRAARVRLDAAEKVKGKALDRAVGSAARIVGEAQEEAEKIKQQARGELAKAVLVAEKEAKRKLEALMAAAKADALETQQSEIAMCRNMRGLVLAGIVYGRKAFHPDVLDAMAKLIHQAALGGTATLKDAKAFMYALGYFSKNLAEAARVCMELERLRIGEPTEIVSVQVEQLTEEEAIRRLEHGAALADLIRRRALSPGVEDADIEVEEKGGGGNGEGDPGALLEVGVVPGA